MKTGLTIGKYFDKFKKLERIFHQRQKKNFQVNKDKQNFSCSDKEKNWQLALNGPHSSRITRLC